MIYIIIITFIKGKYVEAKLIAFIVECPTTQQELKIHPIQHRLQELKDDEEEYTLTFDCPSCGQTHETYLMME